MRTVVIVLGAFALMEPFTAIAHRHVMHRAGLVLHRSHHRRVRPGEPTRRREANDTFPVVFAGLVMLGFAIGFNVAGLAVLVPIGVGITAYGAAYALVHDVYIHRRLPLFGDRTVQVFERLAIAHRRHHDQNGAPYGMLVPIVPREAANGSRPSHEPVDA